MKKIVCLGLALLSTALVGCEQYPSTYPPAGALTGTPGGYSHMTARQAGVPTVPDFVVEKHQ